MKVKEIAEFRELTTGTISNHLYTMSRLEISNYKN